MLSDDELDAISEKLLDKMLKRLAKVVSSEDERPAIAPSNGNGRPPAKCGRVTLQTSLDDVQPTAEDYAHAQRVRRKHARK